MNERIKELMGKTLDDKFSHTWDTMTHEGLLMFSEKFAELIVRECAEIAYNKQYKHSAAHTRGDCAEAIKQHFGVEERAVPILSDDEEALLSGITSSKLFTIEAAKKAFGVEE